MPVSEAQSCLQRVYGSALPTIQGIRAVLEHVGCSPQSADEDYQVHTAVLGMLIALTAEHHAMSGTDIDTL